MSNWLDSVPHPSLAIEITTEYVAAAKSASGRRLDGYDFIEKLPSGSVVASPVDQNVMQSEVVQQTLRRLLSRIGAHGVETALLIPDQVVRVFLLHFDNFPRRAEEAIPMLRWRLKKSVPFDVDDTVVSYMAQLPRGEGVDVLAAVARQRILREYEEQLEKVGLKPGVVASSTLATLPLIEDERPTLLARMAGTTLTTAVVRGPWLCVYRCSDMGAAADEIDPQALLDEIFPAVAYFQDTWKESLAQIRLSGFGERTDELRQRIEGELGCPTGALAVSALLEDRLTGDAKARVDQEMVSLVGWMLNRGA
ncbi:MAG: hypothetical protein HY046_03060 [Acidobacteria bacterium]|nr:hypothetical protein [Acidobacteriota bacterium]